VNVKRPMWTSFTFGPITACLIEEEIGMMREFTFLEAALLHYLGYKLFKVTTSTTEADDRYTYDIPELDIEALEEDLANPETQVEYLPFLKSTIRLKRL